VFFAAALMVALGTLFSSFWILVLNSWMQTPVGYELVDGRIVPTDWLAILFNPSFPYRFLHTVVAVYLTTAHRSASRRGLRQGGSRPSPDTRDGGGPATCWSPGNC
jgi:cytochrome bd-type quinol oxidase subunit 1